VTRKLFSLHVSPWSERARWALDHHRVVYERVEHVPVIGERRLRRIVGPSKPRATVPVFVDGDQVLTESWDIAVHSDRIGQGTKLVPSDREAEVKAWSERADRAMESGRAIIMASMLASPGALDEGAPPGTPSWLRPLMRPIARRAARAFARKYGVENGVTEEHARAVREALEGVRAALKGGPYLLGSFTYADIVMSTLLQGVSPVADRFLKLGPATRRAWTNDAVATEFADLVAWRDALYEKHRPKRA
jgi:glutathione S-transferase